MSGRRVKQMSAGDLTAEHIGQRVTVTNDFGRTASGGLSDIGLIGDAPAAVELFVGGHPSVVVHPTVTVSVGDLDVLGGAS